MIGFLNLRSIAFYGSAIAGVIALFSVTTAYGEAHLKAPEEIDGRYRIAPAGLPDCLNSRPLILVVQQSGTYLTGSLLPEAATEAVIAMAEERPLLAGRWNNQTLTLTGKVSGLPNCQQPVSIEGTVASQAPKADRVLNGVLKLQASSVSFTAQREDSPPTAQPHH